jgi:hypothetical protein
VLLVVSLVRYMTTTPAAQGRLLYPGIAPASLLLALGWTALLRRWARLIARVALVALSALCLATPLAAIAPRFAPPLVTRARELEDLAPVEGGDWDDVRLLGVGVEPERAAPGERVEVRLYWETVDAPATDLRAVTRLWTAGGQLLAQWDEPPANERYPSDLWRAEDVVRDEYSFCNKDGPAVYQVSVTLMGEGQAELGDRPPARTAYRFKLAPGKPEMGDGAFVSTEYVLGEAVRLGGYSLPQESSLTTEGWPLTLYWDVLAEMDEDYSVFVHLVGPDGALLGQGDGAPLQGDYPTSWWDKGEVLADVHRMAILKAGAGMERLPPGSYLLVGLYRMEDGARRPVVDQEGERVPDDAIRIELGGG